MLFHPVTRSEPEVLSVTINTASEWCTQLSSAEIQQSLTQFCEVLVFCIVPEDDMSLIELWFSCWKCLAELNGNDQHKALVISSILSVQY